MRDKQKRLQLRIENAQRKMETSRNQQDFEYWKDLHEKLSNQVCEALD